MKKLIKNTTTETYCVRHCCQDTPKRAVHAEGGAVSINTDVKSEDTEITDTRNHRHGGGAAGAASPGDLPLRTRWQQERPSTSC